MDEQQVRLTHYDPRWRQEFQQTRSSILQSCQGWVVAVEHIGSTAIAGLVARPTIDVLAGINTEEAFEPAANLLEGLNFGRVETPDWIDEAITLCKPRRLTRSEPEPTHRVFLMQLGCPAWERAIRIRDWLQSHAEDAVRFEHAKVERWRNGEGDPRRYRADKAVFFAHLEDQISAALDP